MKHVKQARRIDGEQYKNTMRQGGGAIHLIDDADVDDQKRQLLEAFINGQNDAVDEEINTEHPPYNSVVHDEDGDYYLAVLEDR